MRVTTAFNRLLRLPGASVIDVSFGGEGVIVTVRLRRRRRVCWRLRADRPAARDPRPAGEALAAPRSRREPLRDRVRAASASLPGLRRAPRGGPVGPAGAHHTRDFEDVVAWLAQQMAKTPIAGLLRIGWDTVGQIVERVVADRLDERRLDGLVAIGVDEISYRRGQRYLTTVVDHQGRDRVVRAGPQRRHAAAVLRPPRRSQAARSGRSRSTCPAATSKRSATASPTPRSALTRSTSCASRSARSTRSAATSGTPTTAPTRRPASGSRAPAGRC